MLADAYSLAQRFADGTTDPVAALKEALRGAEQIPAAFITMCEERALREAVAAKARWQAGQPLSPFDGVPVAWKDLYDLAGCVTTAGAKVRLHDQPALRDCSLATALSRAGMVSIGKTNLSELAYSGLGLNPPLRNANQYPLCRRSTCTRRIVLRFGCSCCAGGRSDRYVN